MSPADGGGAQKRALFVANGHGEDSIAAAIVAELPQDWRVDAFPVVGSGSAYGELCSLVGPRSHIPSEGWRHTSGSVLRDVKGGMLSSIWPAIRFLRSARGRYDRVVSVGDAVTPLLCRLAGLPIDLYLDVFKSGYAHRYSAPERWLIRRAVRKTYCRDDMLAGRLRAAGINAVSAGNIMLDTVPYGDYDPAPKRAKQTMIVLLPGSRVWTGESFALQVAAVERLPDELLPDIFVAVAGGVEAEELAAATGLGYVAAAGGSAADLGRLEGRGMVIHLARGAVGNLVEASDLVLSQAGTATQQALGLGKPVITFNRAGNRAKRMADEQALMAEARILTPPDAAAVTRAMQALLENRAERDRLGRIGRERLGGPGTLDAVIADLVG